MADAHEENLEPSALEGFQHRGKIWVWASGLGFRSLGFQDSGYLRTGFDTDLPN